MNERKKTLLWLTVNSSYSHSSLALPLIHQAAEEIPGWTWEKIEITRDEDPAQTAAEIAEKECDLLCSTLYLFNRRETMDILKRVHALSPQTHIAVGGPECTPDNARKMLEDHPFLSSVFTGEGEEFFPGFLRDFSAYEKQKNVIPGNAHAVYSAWEKAPSPVRDRFFRTDKPFVQIETSRGCPMSCAYCTSSGVRTRCRSLESVREELCLLREKGVKEIRVLDRTFNLPQERGEALLALFGEFPEMHFHLEIHPQFLGRSLRERFRNARPGQFHVEAGIQSLDPAVQTAIGRKSSVEETLSGVRFLADSPAFETHTDLIAGLPMQTFDSLKNDLVLLMQARPAEIQLEVLKMLPGTPILKEAGKYGILYAPDPPYDVMKTDAMTCAEIRHAMKYSRLLDLFFNHASLHRILCRAVLIRKEAFLEMAEKLLSSAEDLNVFLNLRKRFLFLAEYFRSIPNVMEELSFQWLLAGFAPSDAPGKLLSSVPEIPEDAVLLQGDAACREKRETKFYSQPYEGGKIFPAFNRAFKANGPCGVWKSEPALALPRK